MALLEQGRQLQEQSMFDRFPELRKIPAERFPSNVFIIPDGNGRWAQSHRMRIQMGHERGAQVIVNAFKDLNELKDKIPFVGAWGLSIDNLQRPQEEVDFLMRLFDRTIRKLNPELHKRGSKFMHLGRKDILTPYPFLSETIERTEEATRKNDGQVIYIAIGFGGEDQEVRIVKKAMEEAISSNVYVKVTPEYVRNLRDASGLIPSADLIIRSSGEHRLSDVGWLQGKGTELYFDKKYFPSFETKDFVKAIVDFSKRDRRFGGRISKV